MNDFHQDLTLAEQAASGRSRGAGGSALRRAGPDLQPFPAHAGHRAGRAGRLAGDSAQGHDAPVFLPGGKRVFDLDLPHRGPITCKAIAGRCFRSARSALRCTATTSPTAARQDVPDLTQGVDHALLEREPQAFLHQRHAAMPGRAEPPRLHFGHDVPARQPRLRAKSSA